MVTEIDPIVRYVSKYGGEVLAYLPDSDTKFVGGIFTYDTYVTLEQSSGITMDDPSKLLEGKGKARGHLKFTSLEDIQAKGAAGFLAQARAQ